MSHNVGVFVDVSNLFYSAKSACVEVNYVRLVEAVQLKGVRCEVISFGISTSNELIEAADAFTEISSLPGIFRNVTSPLTHARESTITGELRSAYSAYGIGAASGYSLPAE